MLEVSKQVGKQEQMEIDIKTAQMMNGSFDSRLKRQIKIREGWALKEEDEEE